jgi:hypothetical protein
MLEGVPASEYGNLAPRATRLQTIGGAVSVAAAAETPFTVASPYEYSYLVYLRTDCTQVGTTGGWWTLRLGTASTIALLLQMPVVAAPVGTSYCWPFPVPWKTILINAQFTVTPNVATMGTWVFTCNGFCSSI